MPKPCSAVRLLALGLLLVHLPASADDWEVPEVFKRFDAGSNFQYAYTDLDSLLDAVVLNVGRSTRKKADPPHAKTGTRMRAKINRATINEGNRFLYEIFRDNEQNQQTLQQICDRLEQLPAFRPLEMLNRDEQLAYWLNLYNVTLLNEIVQVYPRRDLEKMLTGRRSILDRNLLIVAGVPLSLNNIQFGILKENYDGNPLVIYGLYQGVIGGPSIRKTAYTGRHVWGDLIDNALEFINSNRGTEGQSETVFRASSLYARNEPYFPDFERDLRKHLLRYLDGDEREELRIAGRIDTDIVDWTVTDLYGSYIEIGGSISDNSAALMDSAFTGAGITFNPAQGVSANARAIDRYSPDVYKHLEELRAQRAETGAGGGIIAVDEPGNGADRTGVAADPENGNG